MSGRREAPGFVHDRTLELRLPSLPGPGIQQEADGGDAPLARYLRGLREQQQLWLDSAVAARRVASRHADGIDALVQHVAAEAEQEHPGGDPLAVIATGGWGRRELSPFADLDVLFLHRPQREKAVETRVERILYRLWDLGLEVSHAVRTPADCAALSPEHLRVATSLLEARAVVDPDDLLSTMRALTRQTLFAGGTAAFVRRLHAERRRRSERFGDSIYLLEPNLKSGEGGLRDLNIARWAARAAYDADDFATLLHRGAITQRQAEELRAALEWFLNIRARLHLTSGRRQDRLTFEHQDLVAGQLGIDDTGDNIPAEVLMRRYYRHARAVATRVPEILERATPSSHRRPAVTHLDAVFKLHGNQLSIRDARWFSRAPATVLAAFRTAQLRGVTLHPYARERIAESSHELAYLLATDAASGSRAAEARDEIHRVFLEILCDVRDEPDVLAQMHALGVLGVILPEFAQIDCLWRRDLFHVYTVDVHSLHGVSRLQALVRGELADEHPGLTRLAQTACGPEAPVGTVAALFLAMLLHDCGKLHGVNHSEVGADMAHVAALRLGLSQEDAETTALLVRHHLLMSHVATKRDLSDETMIADFSRTVGSLARLDALYLLTFADMSSVGPGVLSHWSAALLDELHGRARATLLRGHRKPDDVARIQAAKNRLREEAEQDPRLRGPLLEDFLESADGRHLLGHDTEELLEQMRVLRRMVETDGRRLALGIQSHGRSRLANVVVACDDRPGLLADLAGTLTANGLDILQARIYSLRIDGRPVAVDVFHVDHPGDPLRLARSGSRWRRLEEDLRQVAADETDAVTLMKHRLRHQPPRAGRLPPERHRVSVDNAVSHRYTVIDVHTEDFPGVLHAVASTLHRLGMSIVVSQISTEAEEVADVFYVVDASTGAKVADPARLATVEAQLLKTVRRLSAEA